MEHALLFSFEMHFYMKFLNIEYDGSMKYLGFFMTQLFLVYQDYLPNKS